MFIAVYTHEIKKYCDVQFFENLKRLTAEIHIVDNSRGEEYYERIKSYGVGTVYHLNIPQHPPRTRFLRNVTQSVNHLRDIFLKTSHEHFFVIESDVIPPVDVIGRFLAHIKDLENQKINWGAIGAKYYFAWHKIHKKGYWKRGHVLSGCTVYRREAIEKIPFRWDKKNHSAFPDAYWSLDANKKGYELFDCDIECEHLYNEYGTRH